MDPRGLRQGIHLDVDLGNLPHHRALIHHDLAAPVRQMRRRVRLGGRRVILVGAQQRHVEEGAQAQGQVPEAVVGEEGREGGETGGHDGGVGLDVFPDVEVGGVFCGSR